MIGTASRVGRGRQDQFAGCSSRLTHGGHHANSTHHPRPCHPGDRYHRRAHRRAGFRSHDNGRAGHRCGGGQCHARHDAVPRVNRTGATGPPPVGESAAGRPLWRQVSAAPKRGTMTLGKPELARRPPSLAYRRPLRAAFFTAVSLANSCHGSRYCYLFSSISTGRSPAWYRLDRH